MTYNIDWLSLTYKSVAPIHGDNPPKCPPGYKVQALSGTNLFKSRFIIYGPNGAKLITLLSEPFSPIISPDCLLVEVANPLLYTGEWYNALYELLPQCCECEFNNIHRLDLCVDWEIDCSKKKVLERLSNNKYYVQGKQSQVIFSDLKFSDRVERDLTQISWGGKQSEIHFKIYNKWKELHYFENGKLLWNKPYIVDQWENDGMQKENVWRWEVSLTRLSTQQFYGQSITLDNLCSDDYWRELLYYLYHRKFHIKRNDGNTNKSRNADIKFLPIPEPSDNIPALYGHKAPLGGHQNYSMVTVINRMMKDFYTPEMASSSTNRAFANTIAQLVADSSLDAYFQKVYNCPPNADELIKEQTRVLTPKNI